jgi:hypothetical protein
MFTIDEIINIMISGVLQIFNENIKVIIDGRSYSFGMVNVTPYSIDLDGERSWTGWWKLISQNMTYEHGCLSFVWMTEPTGSHPAEIRGHTGDGGRNGTAGMIS